MDRQFSTGFYVTLIIVVLFVLGGFYFLFDKVNSLDTRVANLELQTQLAAARLPQPAATSTPSTSSGQAPTPAPAATSTTPTPPPLAIPTAILLDTNSSPSAPPQVNLTISVDSVTRAQDGTLAVNVKVYTGNATTTSAVNLAPLFQLIDLNGGNTAPTQTVGMFGAMPPKSATSGSVLFQTDPTKTDFILQVGTPDSAHYYDFNFSTQTYKETVIG